MYKILKKSEGPNVLGISFSPPITGLSLTYRMGLFTEAREGTGCFVFEYLRCVSRWLGPCKNDSVVAECECEEEVKLPKFRITYEHFARLKWMSNYTQNLQTEGRLKLLWRDPHIAEYCTIYSWPEGTRAFKRVKPIRILTWSEINESNV